MVQNAGHIPKNRQNGRHERLETVPNYLVYGLFFARTERKLERLCKVSAINLRFVSWLVCEWTTLLVDVFMGS